MSIMNMDIDGSRSMLSCCTVLYPPLGTTIVYISQDIFFLSFVLASVTRQPVHYWVVLFLPRTAVIRSLGSGVMYYLTILYYHSQGSTLAPLHSAPLDPLTPLDVLLSSSFSSGSAYTSTSFSDSISDSDSESVSASRSFAVFQSIPF